jgi:hypothetical protein
VNRQSLAIRRTPRTRLRQLIGAGDRILGFTSPLALIGVAANVAWPSIFRTGLGVPGRVAGTALLMTGVGLYLASLIHVVVHVPRGSHQYAEVPTPRRRRQRDDLDSPTIEVVQSK